MIVPVLTQPRADLEEDLDFFFKLCGLKCSAASFNYEMSIVALHNGEIVGFVAGWYDNQPGGFIDLLTVHPDYVGRGVGYYIAAAMQTILIKRGCTHIYAALDNTKLAPMLEKHGWKERKGFFLMEWNNG